MLTTRDNDVVEFLNEYKIASTDTISEILFPSLSACQKRLKVLSDNQKVFRMRDSINQQYLYYTKKPKQLKHSLLVTDFYRELSKRAYVRSFIIERQFDYIRPDSVFAYNGYLAFLEVEISHKGLDIVKYERFKNSLDYKKFFPVFPKIFVVTDKPKENNLSIEFIPTDFSTFRI